MRCRHGASVHEERSGLMAAVLHSTGEWKNGDEPCVLVGVRRPFLLMRDDAFSLMEQCVKDAFE